VRTTLATTVDTALPPTTGRLWFALFAPPVAWAVEAAAAWWLVGTACSRADAPPSIPLRGLLLGGTVIGGVIAVVALLLALDAWRDSLDPGVTRLRSRTRPDFIAAVAMLVAVSFLIGILLTGFAAVMLDICQVMR